MRPLTLLLMLCACAHAQSLPLAADAPPLAHQGEASLEREDPEKGPDDAAKLAAKHGGYVSLMESTRVKLEVPGDQVEALLGELPSIGKVTHRRYEARDVGGARSDLKARVDNLSRERTRYLDLLAAATTIGDAAAIEREVERVTAELEVMEARLAALDARVAQASLQLEFSRELKPGPIGYVVYAIASGVKWLFVRD